MPKKLFEPGNSGRPKGSKNKATRDIRAFLQENVDWNERVENLKRLANEGNMKAEEILWQYGFGKPVEIQIAPMTINHETKDNEPVKHEHTHKLDASSTDDLLKLAKLFAGR